MDTMYSDSTSNNFVYDDYLKCKCGIMFLPVGSQTRCARCRHEPVQFYKVHDNKLLKQEESPMPRKEKICIKCQQAFTPTHNAQKTCPDCQGVARPKASPELLASIAKINRRPEPDETVLTAPVKEPAKKWAESAKRCFPEAVPQIVHEQVLDPTFVQTAQGMQIPITIKITVTLDK